MEPPWTEQSLSHTVTSSLVFNFEEEPGNSATPQNSLDSQTLFIQPDSVQSKEWSIGLSYEPTNQSSFDPYGFKLSPEHSSHNLLDPDEAELSTERAENDLTFDPEPSSSQPDQVDFDHNFEFDITSTHMARDSDPYGFKLSPEPENQEVLDLCGNDNLEEMDFCTFENSKQVAPYNYSNQEVLQPQTPENQEVLENCSHSNQELDLCNNGNKEIMKPSELDDIELFNNEKEEVLDLCFHENQEVVEPFCNNAIEKLLEPCNYDNQEVLEPCSHGNCELLDFSHPENQEVLDLDNHGNQELLDFRSNDNHKILVSGSPDNLELLNICSNDDQEFLGLGSHDNQEVLDLLSKDVLPEANNNQCIVESKDNVSPTYNSSDSDVASEDLLGLELSKNSVCTSIKTNTNDADTLNMANMSTTKDFATSNAPTNDTLLEVDLCSVFGAGGYIGCTDVADDLEPLERSQPNPVAEPVRPIRPVRPPRPSLGVSWKPHKFSSSRL